MDHREYRLGVTPTQTKLQTQMEAATCQLLRPQPLDSAASRLVL